MRNFLKITQFPGGFCLNICLFLYQTNTLSVRFKAQEREKVSVFPDFRTNASIGIILHKHHLMPARTMSLFEYIKYIWNVCAHL